MNKKMFVAGAAVLVLTAGLVRAANQPQAVSPEVKAPMVAQVAAPKSPSVVLEQAAPTEPAGQEQADGNEPAGQEQADANEPAEANDPAGPDDNVQDGAQDGPENPNEAPETPGK